MNGVPDGATHFAKYSNGKVTYFKDSEYCWVALIDGKNIGLTRRPSNIEPINTIDYMSLRKKYDKEIK